ncbi:hypothetical protein NDU88_003658 [Pleurodeles waltl]|uniref:Uncharacterized protein n=1 Tax=Pleurodeles waltl TaxID=8319 RepID=A0AAV7NJX0_PLEWA|nr:hypothetical protein NDU88_003658 [Pleurodeles waltl]
MHGIPPVHPPIPFPGLQQSFPPKGSPGPATTIPQRLQLNTQRLPQCTPLAASAHTPGPDAQLRHRSSAVPAGTHTVLVSTSVPASKSWKKESPTTPRLLCSSLPKVSAPRRCRRHATSSSYALSGRARISSSQLATMFPVWY